MDKISKWLNAEMAERLAMEEDRAGSGILVMSWDGLEDAARRVHRSPKRLLRLCRVSVMRLADDTGDVIGWFETDWALVILVRKPQDADSEVQDSGMNGWLYALRDTAFRVFSASPVSVRFREKDKIRFGAAPIEGLRGKGEGGLSSRSIEHAVVFAALRAWKMALSDSPFAFDLTGCRRPSELSAGERIAVRYAPIVSLSDGTLFGYEAIPFDIDANMAWEPGLFYAESEKEGALYDNDRRFRELAIRGVPSGPRAVKLFLPVPARIVFDPRLYPGSTLNRIEAAGLRPEQVVLVMSDESDGHTGTLHAAIRHYRTQGFRIAFSGMKTERASLERLAELKPDYIRIGREWFPRTARDPAGESLLQAVAALARKEKIVLLADGVDREEQVRPLMSNGVAYAQGPWPGDASGTPQPVNPSVTDRIRQEMRRRFRGAAGALVELAEPAITFASTTPVTEIARYFEVHREAPGFVIVDGGKPVGMLMKEKLHQMLSRQFGLPLYGNRPVSKIMDAQPLVVDESTPVDQLSQTAMAREPDKLYDAVILTRNEEVIGIVSIRALLEWITTMRMSNAQWANPLTGLPGNEPIRRELSRRLDEGRPFSVVYADLDFFKWYNDQYGFHRGDDVIRFTSEALQAAVRKYSPEDSFVGHIGGDDFIVMFDYGNPVRIGEEMLTEFEKGISSFVDRTHGPVRDRSGAAVDGATLSLSLAVLSCQVTEGWTPERLAECSALLKKAVKSKIGSALEWETLEEFHAFADRKGLTVR